jgi:23S rRNA pseudouridine2605 synthase
MQERLQKILAQAGFGSRRDCETFITAGRVRVNGQLATLGQKADPLTDQITLDGRSVKPGQKVYVALNKPRFVLSTVEPEPGDARQTVRELVPITERLYPVGRLDYESEGLVLMTNDGDLANLLTHPRHGHQKEYRVLVARHPDAEQLAAWRRGMVLSDGYQAAPADVRVEGEHGKGAWLRIVMGEGRKRQIREIAQLLGLPVVRIVRTRIGTLRLGLLKSREWRYLTATEVESLRTGKEAPTAEKRMRRTGSHRQAGLPRKGKPPKSRKRA